MLTDSYLLQYERIPEDKDICHRYLPDILISVLECEGCATSIASEKPDMPNSLL
jgi:hypothetical protein